MKLVNNLTTANIYWHSRNTIYSITLLNLKLFIPYNIMNLKLYNASLSNYDLTVSVYITIFSQRTFT